MHFPRSSFLLLTTTVLTSIAAASRPSSATSVVVPDAETIIDIEQREVSYKSVHHGINSVLNGDILADAEWFAAYTVVPHGTHHDGANANDKVKNDIAKRAVVSATTTRYDTKTLTTDIAESTVKPIVNAADSHQVNAKAVANPQAKEVAEPLVNAYSVSDSKPTPAPQSERAGDATKITKRPTVADAEGLPKTRTKVRNPTNNPSNPPVEKPNTKSDTKSRNPPVDTPTGSQALDEPKPTTAYQSYDPSTFSHSQPTAHSNTIVALPPPNSPPPQPPQPTLTKRSPGTFEYVYDSTTLLVTPTPPVPTPPVQSHASAQAPPSATRKLRFGVVALSSVSTAGTRKVHS